MVFKVDEPCVLKARENGVCCCLALLLGAVEEFTKVDELGRIRDVAHQHARS